MKLAFKIASRFLLASKGQTILIIVGIIIGVSVQVFIGSLIDGLQRSLVNNTIGSSAQISIVPEERNASFLPEDSLIDDLEADQEITAVVQVLNRSGFVLQGEVTFPVQVRGFDFSTAEKIYKLSENLQLGQLPGQTGEVLLGRILAEELDITAGSAVTLLTPQGEQHELTVSGIFDLKVAALNETWLLTELETSQKIYSAPGEISAVELQVQDVFAADTTASEIDGQLPDGLKTVNWKDQNEQLLSGLAGQSASSYMIQVFVLLAVLLGISSVLAISVVQKSRQIGILKAMGIKDRVASQIFLLQGFLLGLFGAAIGVGAGLGLSYIFSVFVQNPDGTPLVPFYFDPVFVVFSFLIAVAAATISALIPARKSSALNPIEVIKNG